MKIPCDIDLGPDPEESHNRQTASRFTVTEPFVLAGITSLIADDLRQELAEAELDTYPFEGVVSNAANRLVMSFATGQPRVEANVSFSALDRGSALATVDIVGGLSTPGARMFAKALSRVLL